jgi:hypothetical protein
MCKIKEKFITIGFVDYWMCYANSGLNYCEKVIPIDKVTEQGKNKMKQEIIEYFENIGVKIEE